MLYAIANRPIPPPPRGDQGSRCGYSNVSKIPIKSVAALECGCDVCGGTHSGLQNLAHTISRHGPCCCFWARFTYLKYIRYQHPSNFILPKISPFSARKPSPYAPPPRRYITAILTAQIPSVSISVKPISACKMTNSSFSNFWKRGCGFTDTQSSGF